ncbi:hypothetical protein JAO76_10235 [Pontibacter sp. BT310]|uniref:Gingipain domain-containing protein n=1 Tax=Pontibacter populi TaxID=890055 RepID=A0ABS6XBR2_9BACT|nr:MULTISPECIES: C25 family cysteine peptidase [Pontibacter]MBJ6118571.1 hypothetical protein [Pontibacter sp. BT310]MBR0571000.1 hypothetical protein [Microvirga sp. STS03]MBW3365425.1 hypothetical protein [Pontibacter populi]
MYISAALKRFCLLSLFIVISIVTAKAQTNYGNEWINYEQTYHKIKVTTTGLHQLNYTYLSQLGLEGVNPQNLQLFRRGKEVAVYIAGEQDGKLDPQDYLEFYGERNDGALDAELYKDPSHQHHQFFSLYTDTASYFLTYSSVKGKRVNQENTVANGLTPEPYFMQKALQLFTNWFYQEKVYGLIAKMPWMDEGEGYTSGPRTIAIANYKITGISNIYNSGPTPYVDFRTVGAYKEYHKLAVNIVAPNGTIRNLGRYEYDFYSSARDIKPINFNEINTDGSITMQIAPDVTETKGNAIVISYGRVTYPQKFNFNNNQHIFYTDSLRTGDFYFEFPNITSNIVAYDVTDPQNVVRIAVVPVSTNTKGIVVKNNGFMKKIVVANADKIYKPAGLEKNIRFRKIVPNAHNYIVLTNKRLMKKVSGTELRAPEQYAAYRASQAGGGYDTLLVHMDQVVDQFHYGEFSSNSIRKFMKFMSSSARPKQLFIIGKGVKYASDEYRVTYGSKFSYYHIGGRNPKVHEIDLIPTGITPSSDVFFTADFHNNSYIPKIPTGRLAATRPEDVINYLNKVKEYDAIPEGLPWRKNILQLGGGSSLPQINQIANYLRIYKSIAEGPYLGANVIEKYRQNVSEVVENINVSNEVNNGLSLLTFYGHSSPGTTDLDIGLVSSPINGYSNKGKYPVILMNGCNSGDAFIPNNRSFGEDWINTPEKGAVAFIAHSDAGEVGYLNYYSSNFYTTAFQDPQYYGKNLGEVLQKTAERAMQSSQSNIVIAMAMEMVLQGDPAVRLYAPAKPDYAAIESEADITSTVQGENLTASAESFNIILGVRNWGKAITDSVTVTVKRILADNTEMESLKVKVAPIMYSDVLNIPIDNRGIAARGMNRFEVTLDGAFEVDELNEMNNTASFQHFFPASGLIALAPVKYSIVNSKNVRVVVQTTQIEESRQGFYLEVDTTHHFNSNLKKAFAQPLGMLSTWDLNLASLGNLPDSTVYYWRARFQNYSEGEDTVYATSSFRVISDSKTGWSQSHVGQFQETDLSGFALQTKKPLWEFTSIKSDIEIRTLGGSKQFKTPDYNLIIDGRPMIHQGCSNPAGSATPRLIMVVINNKTLKLVESLVPAYACAAEPFMYDFGDLRTAANRAKLETFINAVPENFYVAAISINNVPFNDFTSTQKAALGKIGSELINSLKTGDPFAIVGQKGLAAGKAYEVTAISGEGIPANQQEIVLKTRILSNQQAGEITSPIIGPALSWGSVHHNIEKYQAGNDDYTLRVIGINAEGAATVLADNVTSKNFDISNIDAKVYPHLQLQAALSDATDRSAPQLDQWLVLYEVAPEGVIRPDLVEASSTIISDQANKGKMKVPMIFQNVSPFAFKDSLAVDVTVTGDGIDPIQKRLKLAPLAGNTSATFNFEMDTHILDGNYKLSMYVNPRIQPEQHYFNNIYVVPFKVKSRLHPIMDVAFDGVHIMDGELISPSPMVSVTVKDENRQAFLGDASGMSIVLVYPDKGEQELALDKTSELVEHVEIFPATEKSDFRVEFKPTKLEDGLYRMEIRAKDVAGKQSGISPYRINFEVENRSAITNFYPFPNPFSTKTNFIFTLTGATIPDHIKIQILTITGKVVKEIMKEELGPLRIGNNKTEYAWDGTDMYGDKLANGVYLYRVVVSRGDEMMYHKQKFGDKAFKNGYGKIYILR